MPNKKRQYEGTENHDENPSRKRGRKKFEVKNGGAAIFVSRLDGQTTVEALESWLKHRIATSFKTKIRECDIEIRDSFLHSTRRAVCIEFEDEKMTALALALRKRFFKGRELSISRWRDPDADVGSDKEEEASVKSEEHAAIRVSNLPGDATIGSVLYFLSNKMASAFKKEPDILECILQPNDRMAYVAFSTFEEAKLATKLKNRNFDGEHILKYDLWNPSDPRPTPNNDNVVADGEAGSHTETKPQGAPPSKTSEAVKPCRSVCFFEPNVDDPKVLTTIDDSTDMKAAEEQERRDYDTLHEKYKTLCQKYKMVKADNVSIKQERDELIVKNKHFATEMNGLLSKCDAATKETDQLKWRFDCISTEKRMLESKSEAHVKEIFNLRLKNASLKKEKDGVDLLNYEMKEERDELRQKLAQATLELQEQCAKHKVEQQKLQEELEEAKSSREMAMGYLESSSGAPEDIEELRKKLMETRAHLDAVACFEERVVQVTMALTQQTQMTHEVNQEKRELRERLDHEKRQLKEKLDKEIEQRKAAEQELQIFYAKNQEARHPEPVGNRSICDTDIVS